MSYCRLGDKAKVTYQFKDGQSTTYESSNSPIEVTTGGSPKNSTSNYNHEGYQITFNSPQGAYGQIQITVIDYQLFKISDGPYAGDYIATIPCGSTSFPYDANGNLIGAVITSPVVINNAAKCPSVNSNIYNLKILSNEKVIFQVEGNCPVTFTVACGEECPNGYCKIDCETYPSYCCISEAEIKSLSNQLNS